MNFIEKQNIINQIIIDHLKIMKIQDRACLIFPITDHPFENKIIAPQVENITALTRKAILGIVNTWSAPKQKDFHDATKQNFIQKMK